MARIKKHHFEFFYGMCWVDILAVADVVILFSKWCKWYAKGCQTNILDKNEHKFLPSSLVAHNGPTHLPLTQRILHKRRYPIGPTSPGKRTSVTCIYKTLV